MQNLVQTQTNLPISKEHFSRLSEGFSIEVCKNYEKVMDEKLGWIDRDVGDDLIVRFDPKNSNIFPYLAEEIGNNDHKRKRDALLRLALHKKPHGIGTASINSFMDDLASDLNGFSALALELACVHIRRNQESPFFPQSKALLDASHAIQFKLKSLIPNNVTQIEYNKSLRMDEYFTKPQDNPVRREICDFLISKGQRDYSEDGSYSNYQLEIMAKSKFGYGKEGEELAHNLSAG